MSPQQTIAHYRIVSKLGEGGMGAVYRATDTKLNRDVAIKVLPDSFANDSDRLARFTREAQVLASLNHPNIAQIYGVEDRALVMELVEGAELKGPLAVDTSIAYAKQLAAALEAAHEKGIVHRDLKPANIKITPEGVLKVLDFGLAKAAEDKPAQTSTSPTISPTLSLEMTQAGMILGTAAYMSPEQARGKAVDKRADIWAFGVVVYEMLTGAMLFRGETASDSMIAVATREPDWSALPADTPPHVRKLLARCLQKDPRLRLRDIGEARIALEHPDPSEAATAAQQASRRPLLPWIAALLTLGLGLAAGALWRRPQPEDTVTARFAIPYPEGTTQPGNPSAAQAVPSPDGRWIALTATLEGTHAIWVRPTGSIEARRLDGTDGATTPFWSPDGQFIAFFADDKLKKVPAGGGAPHTICDAPLPTSVGAGDGGDWNRDGIIVFATGAPGPLQRVSAAGGSPAAFTKLDASAEERKHSLPQFLPDGRHVLYLAQTRDPLKSGIYAQELGSEQRTLVMRNPLRAAWAPPGYLLFARETTLYAQAMEARTLRLSGEPVPIAENITSNTSNGRAAFAVSPSGILVYRTNGAVNGGQLAWYSRDGKRLSAIGPPNRYRAIRLSPDEKTVAVFSGGKAGADLTTTDLLTMDLATGLVTPVVQNWRSSWFTGAWSPDSTRFALNERTEGVVEVMVASGQTRSLTKGFFAYDWSPDGKFLLCAAEASRQLAILPLVPGAQVQTVSSTPSSWAGFAFSPDGRFVAFASQESRRSEVWVASFPSFAEKRQISADGGDLPIWRKDGKELFFRRPDGFIMGAEISTAGKIQSTVPKPLFLTSDPSYPYPRFAPSGDGKRFLVFEGKAEEQAPLRVAVNWAAELKK